MATIFKGDRARCYICDELIEDDSKIFILQGAKANKITYERKYGKKIEFKEHTINLYKSGQQRFVAHESCQNKMMWKQFFPNLDIPDEYYAYIRIGRKNNKRVWYLGKRIIQDNPTKESLDELVSLFAKDLLNETI
jgi:hypothetical protein